MIPSTPVPAPVPSPAPESSCPGPDPFIGIPGLVGVCVNGGWVPVPGERETIAELLSAPTIAVVDGVSLSLTTTVWVNLMPMVGVPGLNLSERGPIAILHIDTSDASSLPATVVPERCWLVAGDTALSAPIVNEYVGSWVARFGPGLGFNAIVDVIVRLRDGAGRTHLLRAPLQVIGAAY